jgi:hypothetical protein
VILHRCFAWNQAAKPTDSDGPLWFPRMFQGDGRHDNPDLYGCLYLTEHVISCVVEQLARFRGQELRPSFLVRRGLPLAVASLRLADAATLIDLDDPGALRGARLRPSLVATRRRETTQAQARAFYERQPRTAGLRWWSIHEASWVNITLFDRAARHLRVESVRPLQMDEPVLAEAAQWLGIA